MLLLKPAPLLPMCFAQIGMEFSRMVRTPAFALTSLLLPIMFYAFFGIPEAQRPYGGTTAGLFMLGSFAAYAVITITMFSFGASVANERGSGATRLMRATPLRPGAYLAGKIVAAMGFAAVGVASLTVFAMLAGHVHIAAATWVMLLMRLLLGSVPFIVLGFAVGYLSSINSAIGILNLINLPLSFASGLFVPVSMLPSFVRPVAPYLPTYHFGQLAWGAFGANQESWQTSALWLAGYTVLFTVIALRAYRRDERKEFA